MMEHDEQKAVIRWARENENKYPELVLLFAIPNGGKRHISVAKKMKAEGVKKGVPDLFLPVPQKNTHGLWIEMKNPDTGRLSREQSYWIRALIDRGYRVAVCYGHEEAIEELKNYMGIK